jgi:hypothetical protein
LTKQLENIPFPVLAAPYLIAMKLRAGSPQEHADILDLYRFLSDEEKEGTLHLAILIKLDKNLKALLAPRQAIPFEPLEEDQLI